MKAQLFGARSRDKIVRIVILSLVAITIALPAGSSLVHVSAQQANRAGLVVDFGDHHETYCIEFNESEITGYEMLRRAGLNLVTAGSGSMGFAVCDINGTSGCPASNCFCQCQGSTCTYWSYHHLVNGSWQYSQKGASGYKVQNGDVEGWGWGEGVINSSGEQPPIISFDQICAPPATDTPVPTETPLPPTDTPVPPTETPAPTAVPVPEAWFRLDDNPVAVGSCTTLRWDTSHAREAYLDGEEVGMVGSRQVCPTTPTHYVLRLIGAKSEQEYELTLGVTGATATATGPAQQASASPSPSATAEPRDTTQTTNSPTTHGGASPSPSFAATSASSATPAPAGSTPPPTSPSPTPRTQVTQAEPDRTPGNKVEAEAEPLRERSDHVAESESDSAAPLVPVGYITFSLIVGGLLGWLFFIVRFRR